MTDLVITKIDVLSDIEKIKVLVGYEVNGKQYDYIPASLKDYGNSKAIYKEFDGWMCDIKKVRKYDDLPANCKKYLEFIEEYTKTRISLVSVGPDRENNIIINEL